MTLHIYFARRYFHAFLILAGIISGFIFLIEMVETTRRFNTDALSLLDMALLTLLTVPNSLYAVLPLIMIMASIVLFLNLARTSEMVVTRATGRSASRALIAPSIVAFAVGVFALTALNPIVSATQREHERRTEALVTGEDREFSVSPEGLWLRQGSADGQTVIHARRANLDGTELYRVSFVTLSPEGRALSRIEASRAELVPGYWMLRNAKEWRLDGLGDIPEQTATKVQELDVQTNLTREGIRDSFGTPSAIPIWDLPAFISQLDNAGFSALNHRVWFQTQLALPLTCVAMVMLGACFTMRHTRMGRTGLMVLLSVMMGFSLYFLRNLAQILAENGQVPVFIAAWAPPFAAILLTLGLLMQLEDG
ncbi:MAG: LPS export ABC transporter permease LptG [Pseudomonadota bacterium]